MTPSSASLAAGVLAYAFATFAGNYVWHMVVFNSSYESLKVWTNFDEPVLPLGVATVVLQGLLFSHMLPLYQSAKGSSGLLSGARFGLWVAGIVFSTVVLDHSAKNEVACVEGFAILEGAHCILQYPVSMVIMALAQRRASGRAIASTGTKVA